MGALVAGGYYHFVKFFNYEDATPGQDSSGGELSRHGSNDSGSEHENEGRQDRDVEQGRASGYEGQQRNGGAPSSQGRQQQMEQVGGGLKPNGNGAGYHPGY